MRLLALDTAGDGCSAGVFADGVTLALRYRAGARGHAEQLPEMVSVVLAESGCELARLDALAVTIGPGSFTGIRTGLAAVRGLALVTGLGAYGVTTLEALAAALPPGSPGGPFAAVLDARRGQVYLQLFSSDRRPLDAPWACSPAAAAAELSAYGPLRLVGSGAALVAAALGEAVGRVAAARLDAAAVARAAAAMAARGAAPVSGFALRPLYLRDADARADAGRSLLAAGG